VPANFLALRWARCCQKLTDKLKEEFLSILCWAIGHPPAGRVNKMTNSVVRSEASPRDDLRFLAPGRPSAVRIRGDCLTARRDGLNPLLAQNLLAMDINADRKRLGELEATAEWLYDARHFVGGDP
jgi:hypothetical protein